MRDTIYSFIIDIRHEIEPDDITMVDCLVSVVGRSMSKRSPFPESLQFGEANINIRMIYTEFEEIYIRALITLISIVPLVSSTSALFAMRWF